MVRYGLIKRILVLISLIVIFIFILSGCVPKLDLTPLHTIFHNPTPEASITPTPTLTITPDVTVSPGLTPSFTASLTASISPTRTPTRTLTPSITASRTPTATNVSAPVARPGRNYIVSTGNVIPFDASASYDPNNKLLTYQWDFGDGIIENKKITTHIYIFEGEYTVKLTVTNSDGLSNSATKKVTVLQKNYQLLINELYINNESSALEIYNAGDYNVNLNGWTVNIQSSQLYTINITQDINIPSQGYLVITSGNLSSYLSDVNYMINNNFALKYWYGNGESVTLLDPLGVGVDFVQYNTNTYLPPNGTSWDYTKGIIYTEKDYTTIMARKVNGIIDSDSASDWIETYETLGFPNNSTSNVNIPIYIR